MTKLQLIVVAILIATTCLQAGWLLNDYMTHIYKPLPIATQADFYDLMDRED